jgi:hypothetical protein
MSFPEARTAGIVIQEAGEEILIYDLKANKALCLNETAGRVYKECSGSAGIAEIAANCRFDTDITRLTLSELERAQLIDGVWPLSELKTVSRRQMIRKAGLASMGALPLISSVVAPRAINAASCLGGGKPCTADSQCCSGNNCQAGICTFCAPAGTACGDPADCCSRVCNGGGGGLNGTCA